jgi:hypothetical protein
MTEEDAESYADDWNVKSGLEINVEDAEATSVDATVRSAMRIFPSSEVVRRSPAHHCGST